MALPKFKISLENAAGDYYSAVKAADNTWTVTTDPAISYLNNLPLDWDNSEITWERNMEYMGVFRSQTNNFTFVEDGRAIILDILFSGIGGVNAYCRIKIWMLDETGPFVYNLFYQSEFELLSAKDNKRIQQISVPTRDNNLQELLKSRGSSKYNLPYWDYDAGTGTWSSPNAVFIEHRGLKCFWRADFVGAETSSTPFLYSTGGFDGGRHGAMQGCHTVVALANKIIVQNNGATTYIGNDILQPVLRSSAQQPSYNEVNFIDSYNRNVSYMAPIQPLIDEVSLTYRFDLTVNFTPFGGGHTITYPGGSDFNLKFVLFELLQGGEPTQTTPGLYDIYATLLDISLPSGGSPYTLPTLDYSTTNDVFINKGKAYILAIIFDDPTGTSDVTNICSYNLINIGFTISSIYNSGTSTDVVAPRLPTAFLIGMRPIQVFEKLMKVFDSIETDAYGFPIPTGVGYAAASDFLSDDLVDSEANYDLIPNRAIMTSENVLRSVVGTPYMSISLFEFWGIWNKINNLFLGLEDDNTTVRIEPLEYWFEDALLLALGADVAELEIIPYVDFMGSSINGGYDNPQTNNNFGTDIFCIPMQWNTPLNSTPNPLDYRVSEANADMYYIEKALAQNNSNVSTQSSNNGIVLLEITDTTHSRSIPDPEGGLASRTAYDEKTYTAAQSTDDTAATDPYIKGFYYPDTVTNTGLTPASNIYRCGSLFATMCDGLPTTEFISVRHQYNMQYNDYTTPVTTRPGMSKRTSSTAMLIKEMEDISLADLNPKVFRPWILSFKSGYPINMYTLINANPRRYISFIWKGVTFKGYIKRVTQAAGNNAATVFELLAHPSTTDAQLKMD